MLQVKPAAKPAAKPKAAAPAQQKQPAEKPGKARAPAKQGRGGSGSKAKRAQVVDAYKERAGTLVSA